ncbi:MAG TPA: hypothetical protein PK760_06180, partial [Flavobacteriales bacterium]|nr:hypothetical protein [Flavobacteriales bacterium]
MILRALLTTGLLYCFLPLHAQTFDWAAAVQGGGMARAVAVDAEGNVYSVGNANAQVDFDPGPGVVLSPPGSGTNGDVYVVKYDNAGNYVWHYVAGNSDTQIAKNVVVDGAGDVLVTGYFTSSFDWDPGPNTVQIAGYYDSFVLKLSAAGEFLWVQHIGGGGEEQCHGLAVDADNNVYVSGSNSDNAIFGNSDTTFANDDGGAWNGYYAKYSADGNFLWAKSISGSGSQIGHSIACAGDRLYLYGACSGATTVNGTHTVTTPAGQISAYLCKTDTAGNVIWLKSQTSTNSVSGEVVRTNGSNIYLFASFRGTVDADPGDGTLQLVPPSDSYPQTLFAKLDTSGNAVWARQLQGNVHFDSVGDIALDAAGGVVVTCAIAQTQDYDPGPGEAI